MRSFFWVWLNLVLVSVSLSSCGGGSGSSNAGSSFSASPPVIPAPIIIAPDNQSFTTDEDQILKANLKISVKEVFASGGETDATYSRMVNTLKGGVVELALNNESENTQFTFYYRPAEDFNGDDEAVVYLTAFGSEQHQIYRQTIKIKFNVRPVEDENFKFKIKNKKVFVAGNLIQLGFPYHPDTQEVMPTKQNFTLSIDGISLDYSIGDDGLEFVMPPHVAAGVNKINIEFEHQGRRLSVAQTLMSKIDYGDVEYWMGDKSRRGITYVVMAEKSVDREKYLNWINTEFTLLLAEPIVAEYSDYWNLVVIKQPATENYASVINELKSPIVIGNLGDSGEAFVKNFVPNYDWVLLNTSLDGRATGGYPMTLNFSSMRTILHELGHAHAKLGDEYGDKSVNEDPFYFEGLNPNVTNHKDYNLIPWKHWIIDKEKIPGVHTDANLNEVGVFLGAYYALDKFYRPMLNSLMRDNNEPLGPVNSEAWVLATYERMGILDSVSNTKEANLRKFTVSKNWNKKLTKVDWFVNDIKQEAWTNFSSITVDETQLSMGRYSVKAELTDLLGYIKDPHAYPAFKGFDRSNPASQIPREKMNETFQKIWTFEKSTAVANLKLQKQEAASNAQDVANSYDWVSHNLFIQQGVHRLTTTSYYHLQDALIPVTARSEFSADVINAGGEVIYSIGIDNPYQYYHDATGMVMLRESGNYKIKHPHIEGPYKIEIFNRRTSQVVLTLSFPQERYN